MKTKILLLVMVLGFGFSSCEKFLEENNQSGLTADQFYNTELGMNSVVNSCYSGLRLWYGREHPIAMCVVGTDLFLRGGDNKANQISDYTVDLNGGQTNIRDAWEDLYKSLNVCNTAISLLPSELLSDAVNTRYQGEVHFLRALYLWLIVETWGDVILNTEPTVGVVTTAQRSSVASFYEVIFSDLDLAISKLAPGKSADGRITQDAAMAFKARACLTRASQTGDAALYAEAASLAKQVIATNSYAFFDDYAALWDVTNSEGSTNSEAIFYVNYTNDETLNGDYDATSAGSREHLFYVMVYDKQAGMTRDVNNGRPWQRYMPSLHLLNLFDETVDQRYYGSFKTLWISNIPGLQEGGIDVFPLMAEGDTAIWAMKYDATSAQKAWAAQRYKIYDRSTMYEASGKPKLRSQFIELHKFFDETRATANQTWSSRDVFVIRLSEMYLIIAEAELNTNLSEATGYMNILRRQRAYPGMEEEMEITEGDMDLDFILEERARELCGEQIRWYDLKRTGKLVEYVRAYNPDAKDNIQDYHTVRPIPQVQLDAVINKDEFTQNQGYN
ncbi:MAG: RagB/SusD family nutrient uptake outer membrane protein [Mangrovibacterium sp.]